MAGRIIGIANTSEDIIEMRGRGVVITTTNARHLARLSGEETGAIEIVGKPNDIQEVVEAMRRALPK